jgi:hypothetical protein
MKSIQLILISSLFLTSACGDDGGGGETVADTGATEDTHEDGAEADMISDGAPDIGEEDIADAREPDAVDMTGFGLPDLCHPVRQTCRGELSKCTVLFSAVGLWAAECVEDLGDDGVGESCERPTGTAGIDTCAPGLYCAFWELPRSNPQERICQILCENDDDCPDTDSCYGIGTSETFGVCLTRCSLLPDDCPEGTKCGLGYDTIQRRSVLFCDFDGPVQTVSALIDHL